MKPDLEPFRALAGQFRCPNCGGTVTEPGEETPAKTNHAKRKSRK